MECATTRDGPATPRERVGARWLTGRTPCSRTEASLPEWPLQSPSTTARYRLPASCDGDSVIANTDCPYCVPVLPSVYVSATKESGGPLELVLPDDSRVALVDEVTIGRDAVSTLRFSDPSVSREHARISPEAGGGAVLADAGVRVRTEPIARLAGTDGRLEQIEFEHGSPERREALFVNTRRDQPNGLAAALGCELTPDGTIVTDGDGRTDVAGVYAAGDAATAHSRSVANAIGAGSRVAYAVALERLAPLVAAAA